MTVVQCDDDSKCVALGQGNLFVGSVICYNATPLPWFVLFIDLVVWFKNKWFVNYVIVSLPLIFTLMYIFE